MDGMQGEGHRGREGKARGSDRGAVSKGGGWKFGYDGSQDAGRGPGLRTSRKEERVEVKSEGMTRAMRGQSRVGCRAGWRARQRAGSAERNPAHCLWISRALDERWGRANNISTGKVEGSIYDRTEGEKGRVMEVQVQALVEGRTAAKAGEGGKEEE